MIGIYKIENKINHKVYVGQSIHIESRWKTHQKELRENKHGNSKLQNAYNKYGDVFEYTVLAECSKEELNNLEQFYIKKFNSKNDGYNETIGGDGLSEPTIAVRKKISDKLKGSNNGMYNVHLIGELNGMYGKHHTEESKQKMSDAAKSRKHYLHSEETKQKISESHKKIQSRGNNNNAKKVICVNTNEVFNCIKDAAEQYSIAASKITKCCLKKTNFAGYDKLNNPLVWQYYID